MQPLDNDTKSLEEACRVIKIDDNNYVGAHPLRLPMAVARGVYGGHTVAQSLYVAMEAAPENYVPHSFHSHFIGPGKATIPFHYKVDKLVDDGEICKFSIQAIQKDLVKFVCMVSLVPKGSNKNSSPDIQIEPPSIMKKYDPNNIQIVHHTDFVRNAYSPELIDFTLVPEENSKQPAERWVTLFSGIDQKVPFVNPMFNYVGLANLSDSAFLTTMARVLHFPWNPSTLGEDFDSGKDAMQLIRQSLNILHIFHYNAMSLDHHIYFHTDNPFEMDVVNDWLCFTYQFKRVSNNRSLVRGYLLNKDYKCVATVIQEGLTIFHSNVAEKL